jgi:mannose-6-phosphate isomerase-like protein (cupin superfamily)
MAGYTVANLKSDVEDQAPNFGLSPNLEAHFAREALDCEDSGVSYQRVAPGFRVPFGHQHSKQEEIYVIVGGSGRLKLDDDVIDVKAWDAIRVATGVMRGAEAGDDGMELIAFGARSDMKPSDSDADMEQGWWSD